MATVAISGVCHILDNLYPLAGLPKDRNFLNENSKKMFEIKTAYGKKTEKILSQSWSRKIVLYEKQ